MNHTANTAQQRKTVLNERNFVGNRRATSLDLIDQKTGKSLRERYHIGPPMKCPLGDADKMAKDGYVGIYEKASTILERAAYKEQRFLQRVLEVNRKAENLRRRPALRTA